MEQQPTIQNDILENNPSLPLRRARIIQEQERKERRERRLRWLHERAYSARSGFLTTLAMGSWAIRQAVRTEDDPRMRRERENILLARWRRFSGDLATMPYLRHSLFI